jgi:hypothetical protein
VYNEHGMAQRNGSGMFPREVMKRFPLLPLEEEGRMDYHVAGRADEYIGRISGEFTLAQAGAAFLLLVWPAYAEHQ